MKRKKLVLAVFVIITATSLGAFAKHSETLGRIFRGISAAQNDDGSRPAVNNLQSESIFPRENPASEKGELNSANNASQQNLLPDEIAFDVFLTRVATMEKAALKAETRGKSGAIWRNYLKGQGFTENEIAVIREAAKEYVETIAPIQTRAAQIIKTGRASLAQGKTLPPAPAELGDLQRQRNRLANRIKNKLQIELGAETVEKTKMLVQRSSNNIQIDAADMPDLQNRINELKKRKGNFSQEQGGQPQ